MRLSSGFTAPAGTAHLVPLLERIQSDNDLPELARELFTIQERELAQVEGQLREVEAKLVAWHRADECSRRLAQIPGIGPIGANDADYEDALPRGLPFRAAVCRLDRTHAAGPLHGGQGPTGWYHSGG